MSSGIDTSPECQDNKNHCDKNISALKLIFLLGIISLFGSFVSDATRSVMGPFLLTLGASGAIVGLVTGLGEFSAYGLRIISGYYLDQKRKFWQTFAIGYGLLFTIPLLFFTRTWELAAVFLISERVGKAIRAPSRDTILSYATDTTGRGWGFGIHKSLDQIGPVIGPVFMVFMLEMTGNYEAGFAYLTIPLVIMLLALLFVHRLAPRPEEYESIEKSHIQKDYYDFFIPYAVYLFLIMAGFASFPIISYHMALTGIVEYTRIPLYYSLAMIMTSIIALISGRVYDRKGVAIVGVFPVLNIIIAYNIFFGMESGFFTGMILWGIQIGMINTTLKATIADFSNISMRGTVYGILNAVFGTSWLLGSFAIGVLYDISVFHVMWFVVILQMLAVIVFIRMIYVLKKRS
ncbi:MFS transporter [Methanochimaera problematica]|nr:MFS transporter [Methanoplanus sp. FWC-SCC4]